MKTVICKDLESQFKTKEYLWLIKNLIHCKNLCKCHNVPPPITTIKEKNVFEP
jgi:hypothetical protein